jgi:hypothetical protein
MKSLFLLLSLTLGKIAFAQDEPYFPDMRSWRIGNNDTTDRYIFADTALIRSAPNTKRKSAIYTWDAVNEKIPGPAK